MRMGVVSPMSQSTEAAGFNGKVLPPGNYHGKPYVGPVPPYEVDIRWLPDLDHCWWGREKLVHHPWRPEKLSVKSLRRLLPDAGMILGYSIVDRPLDSRDATKLRLRLSYNRRQYVFRIWWLKKRDLEDYGMWDCPHEAAALFSVRPGEPSLPAVNYVVQLYGANEWKMALSERRLGTRPRLTHFRCPAG